MFLTRIGFGSKAVITGDTTQVDVQHGRSGLEGLERILTDIDEAGSESCASGPRTWSATGSCRTWLNAYDKAAQNRPPS